MSYEFFLGELVFVTDLCSTKKGMITSIRQNNTYSVLIDGQEYITPGSWIYSAFNKKEE